MKFRFGRKDCIPDKTENLPYDFATVKPEGQENPHENIGPLLKHLKANLNMKARDFIALSSIHGMVRPFQAGSIGTKYRWLGSGPYLSNMYYKFLVNKPTYDWDNGFGMNPSPPSDNNAGEGQRDDNYTNFVPVAVGDIDGNPVPKWGFRVGCSDCWNTSQTAMGGPCVWRPATTSSPDCPNRDLIRYPCYGGYDKETSKRVIGGKGNAKSKKCCLNVTFDQNGIQKGGDCAASVNPTSKSWGWSNMFALNYEVGLTHKFDLDPVALR